MDLTPTCHQNRRRLFFVVWFLFAPLDLYLLDVRLRLRVIVGRTYFTYAVLFVLAILLFRFHTHISCLARLVDFQYILIQGNTPDDQRLESARNERVILRRLQVGEAAVVRFEARPRWGFGEESAEIRRMADGAAFCFAAGQLAVWTSFSNLSAGARILFTLSWVDRWEEKGKTFASLYTDF